MDIVELLQISNTENRSDVCLKIECCPFIDFPNVLNKFELKTNGPGFAFAVLGGSVASLQTTAVRNL